MNTVDEEWQRVLAGPLNNNMLMDSAKGKTAFACGVGFVLSWLHKDWPEVDTNRVYDDLKAFVDAYMQSRETTP